MSLFRQRDEGVPRGPGGPPHQCPAETVPGLPGAYFMVRVAELEAVPLGFTTCTVQVRTVAPTFTATLIWLADDDWIVVPCSVVENPL